MEIVQWLYLARFIGCFEKSGVLSKLAEPHTPARLAKAMGWKESSVLAGLELIFKTTDILVKDGESYRLRFRYRDYRRLRFHIQKVDNHGLTILAGHPRSSRRSGLSLDYRDADR